MIYIICNIIQFLLSFRATRILNADFISKQIRTLPFGLTKFYIMGLLSAYFMVDKQIPI